MADYYPLLSRAVAGLETNSGESRRALYERARGALVAQLRGMSPPPSESEITRERLGLEEAIRRVETEVARSQRSEPMAHRAAPPVPPAADTAKAAGEDEPPAPRADLPEAPVPFPPRDAQVMRTAEAPKPAAPAPFPPKERIERFSGGESTKELFRNAVKEAAQRGDSGSRVVRPLRPIRDAVARVEPARLDPDLEPDAMDVRAPDIPDEPDLPDTEIAGEQRRAPPVQRGRGRPIAPTDFDAEDEPTPAPQTRARKPVVEPRRKAPAREPRAPIAERRRPVPPDDEPEEGRGGFRFWTVLVVAAVVVLLAAAIGILAATGRLDSFIGGAPKAPMQAGPPQPDRPKISDRVNQESPRQVRPAQPQGQQPQQPVQSLQTTPSGEAAPAQGGEPPAQALQVAQRAILYEEDPAAGQQGQILIGTVAWRTETVTPPGGRPPDIGVRAEVQVPDRRMSMTLTFRRNADPALPASHTMDLLFNTPADFPFGGVAKVPGVLAKRAEGQRGAPLAGLAVDVTPGYFIVGLSAVEADLQRNVQLLKERAWVDIPVVYKNGRRAILSIEKGLPGERAFNDAFAAWGQ